MATENAENNENTSGAGGSNTNPSGNGENNNKKNDSVSYESYLKAVNESKAAKEKLREAQALLEKSGEDKMKADGDWKGLLESRDNKINELSAALNEIKSQYGNLNSQVLESKKLSKVLGKLGGDLDNKYFNLIDLDEVKVNPDTGEIDDISVSEVAERYKTTFPETLKSKINPNMLGDNGGSNKNAEKIKYSDWEKLSYKDQVKWLSKKESIID